MAPRFAALLACLALPVAADAAAANQAEDLRQLETVDLPAQQKKLAAILHSTCKISLSDGFKRRPSELFRLVSDRSLPFVVSAAQYTCSMKRGDQPDFDVQRVTERIETRRRQGGDDGSTTHSPF